MEKRTTRSGHGTGEPTASLAGPLRLVKRDSPHIITCIMGTKSAHCFSWRTRHSVCHQFCLKHHSIPQVPRTWSCGDGLVVRHVVPLLGIRPCCKSHIFWSVEMCGAHAALASATRMEGRSTSKARRRMSLRSGSGRRCSAASRQPPGPLQLHRKLGAPPMKLPSSEMCVFLPSFHALMLQQLPGDMPTPGKIWLGMTDSQA